MNLLELRQHQAREITKGIVRVLFRDDYGEPFNLTDTQADIFNMVWLRKYPRNIILTYTQFGKTDTISMALVLRSQVYQEPWIIVAGKKSKGMLIMQKVIQHLFDNPRFYKQLEVDPNMPLSELKRSRAKDHVTWLGGGSIRVLSGNTGNKNQVKEALIGEGGRNILEEEAPHIPDDVHAMIMRMLMGHKDNFLLKIGNAFNRNHYYRSWHSATYHKVFADYHKGIAEGRITEEMINEVRDLPFFSELYECLFPEHDDLTIDGYRQLISDALLNGAFITEEEYEQNYCEKVIHTRRDGDKQIPKGQSKLGGDFAGHGRDRTAYVIRWPKVARVLSTNKVGDTMAQVPIIEDYIDDYGVDERDVGLDYGGLGQGIGDRMLEKNRNVNLIMFGESAPPEVKHKYKNMRAYMYYEAFLWLKNGGKLVMDDSFFELLFINYKEDSERKLQIQSKEELKKLMKAKGIRETSPDIADAFVLTFADNSEMVGEDDFGFI